MRLHRHTILSIAARVGLYHFAIFAAAGLLDVILSPRKCHPSATADLVRVVELPGLLLLRSLPSSFDGASTPAFLAIAGFLRVVAASSLLYGVLVALVLSSARTYAARVSK